jgi:hypothetical protein
MREIWLRTNRRPLQLALFPAIALVILAPIGFGFAHSTFAQAFLALLWLSGLSAMLLVAWQMQRPRLACRAGELLVFLRWGAPVRVPIGLVECFFLGHGPANLPGRQLSKAETANVVVRLAERATEFSQRRVFPPWGRWCDGYITISGAWCEPLTPALLTQLNDRLRQSQQTVQGTAQ